METSQKYIDKIFGTFGAYGFRVGAGGFYTQTWENDKQLTKGQLTHLYDVLNVLIQNGHIANDRGPDQLPFLTWTESGYEYTQGGGLSISDLSLNELLEDTDGACGFETPLISNDLMNDLKSIKFLPLARIGEPQDVMPDYLGNRNALIWHDGDDDAAKFQELLDDLNAD